jgi:hypothetical protein
LSSILVVAVPFLLGCVSERPIHIRLDEDVHRPEKSVVIFLPDGMDAYRMHDLAAQGRLPNIKRVFMEGGVGVRHAVSSMPSITYPNCSSVITGRFPGHHDIMGNFWFDRQELISRDYMTYGTYRTVNVHMIQPTLYDILSGHFTLNIQGHTRRGVTQTIDNENMFAWAWVTGRYIQADRYVGVCFEEAAMIANRVNRWPSVIMTYYPGVDEVGHVSGPGSGEYASALENIDGVVGRVTEAFEEAGLSDSTYYVLLADHGMAPIQRDQQMDLRVWLRKKRGMRLLTSPLSLENYVDRYEKMKEYDAVVAVESARVARIYLQGEHGWSFTPSSEEVAEWIEAEPAIPDLPAVDLALYQVNEDAVGVVSARGRALIERRRVGKQYEYRIAEYKGDPLDYKSHSLILKMMNSDWHRSRDWLRATAHVSYPDFVPQAVEMFDSPRAGEVVLFAADGWALNEGEKGGHGSIAQRDMRIPMYFAGPDLPRGAEIPYGRLVDVTPTILGLLEESHRLEDYPPVDGVNMENRLRNASELEVYGVTGAGLN